MDRLPCVYILTNQPKGTLYAGVTSQLPIRIWQHRQQCVEGFTKRYNLHMLVWYEVHGDMYNAIKREKLLKRWKRDWKIQLIEEMNPQWQDLYPSIL